jgi:hypothetical protein
VVYNDVINYKKNGLNGMVNDCSQRPFFPNGFSFFIYGQVQFDTSLKYEDLMEDYFSHAYGEDWREVVKILEGIGECFDHKFMARKRYIDVNIGKWYNPAMAPTLRKMPAVAESAKEFLDSHKNMPMRAQTVAYKLLRYYMEYCTGLARCVAIKCMGAGVEAKEEFEKFLFEFCKHEVEIETYYDQYMMGYIFSLYFNKLENMNITTENEFAAH